MKKISVPKIPVYSGIYLGLICAVFEILFQCWISASVVFSSLVLAVCFSAGFGLLIGGLLELIPRVTLRKWLTVFVAVVLAVLYLMEFFVNDAYHMFMTPSVILHGAKGVAEDYGDLVADLLIGEFPRILLMMLPAILIAVFCGEVHRKKPVRIASAAAIVVVYALGVLSTYLTFGSLELLGVNFDYEGAIRSIGVPSAFLQSAAVDSVGAGEEMLQLDIPQPMEELIPAPTEPEKQEQEEEEPEVIVYEPNVLPLDFAALNKKGFKDICQYIQAQTPSMKNEYTGLFEGKNLILITAEAFTAEVIDAERTPTLYRLANQGIHFTNYYQPAWGGSTTGGEMSNIFGLVPDCSGGMIQISSQKPFITMGHQLIRQGYYSMAFHNNTGTFYNRNNTHEDLGYAQFITPDNGMEVTGKWPQSDLEMMVDTIPRYIQEQPFSVYYMTVSGHSLYSEVNNAMTRKNYDVVKDLPYTEPVKCYLAANMELEYAMEYLVNQLEEAGIADDTVIVISPDHYPYGLDASKTWGNQKNCLEDLFGMEKVDDISRDHSALIIWSGCLEGMNIVVDDPVFSLDILPTLSNLFGLDYDSRILVGRDVFSGTAPLVFWPNASWITREGTYYAATREFVPNPDVTVADGYVDYMTALCKAKRNYSFAVQRSTFLKTLGKMLYETK